MTFRRRIGVPDYSMVPKVKQYCGMALVKVVKAKRGLVHLDVQAPDFDKVERNLEDVKSKLLEIMKNDRSLTYNSKDALLECQRGITMVVDDMRPWAVLYEGVWDDVCSAKETIVSAYGYVGIWGYGPWGYGDEVM